MVAVQHGSGADGELATRLNANGFAWPWVLGAAAAACHLHVHVDTRETWCSGGPAKLPSDKANLA